MGTLSPTGERLRISFTVPVMPYWRDHRVTSTAVLPAVEALQILARTLPKGSALPLVQEGATFRHLLPIAPQADGLSLIHEFTPITAGQGCSRLLTLRRGQQTGALRPMEHASLYFASVAGPSRSVPVYHDALRPGKRPGYPLARERLYQALVPFGPAYHNVIGEVNLTPEGATALVSGGQYREAEGPLGSPFPFDAALHLACAWGQRYGGLVTFPVAFLRREIRIPTEVFRRYHCQVRHMADRDRGFAFHITLFTADGDLAEVCEGVEMQTLAQEGRRPPAWVQEGPR